MRYAHVPGVHASVAIQTSLSSLPVTRGYRSFQRGAALLSGVMGSAIAVRIDSPITPFEYTITHNLLA